MINSGGNPLSIDFGNFYRPPGAPTAYALASFTQAFALYGYEASDTDSLESGFEKVAIYVGSDGLPTHMARQLESGVWTSKLGEWEDIEHGTLTALRRVLWNGYSNSESAR